eukprot:CAMPEP_0171157794 /NCGR_PEP_ID=MMETSP0790-20130122/2154_1 /TAXON_ID=2925 /ORGANISM="Alexandrium catenella, Strain OF101" /LENGTH=46 /DNA_ID= /DNA_START= /DNA_END= /DNA_ORIENTATION=
MHGRTGAPAHGSMQGSLLQPSNMRPVHGGADSQPAFACQPEHRGSG